MNDLLDANLDQPQERNYSPKAWVFILWFAVILIGYLFKIMHWPGSAPLRIAGASGIISYNLVMLYYFRGRNTVNNVFCILSLVYLLWIFWGEWFNGGYPFNMNGIIGQFGGIALFTTVYVIIFVFKRQKYTF